MPSSNLTHSAALANDGVFNCAAATPVYNCAGNPSYYSLNNGPGSPFCDSSGAGGPSPGCGWTVETMAISAYQSATNVESGPWWTVDLGSSFAIGAINIQSTSIVGFQLEVGMLASGASNPVCASGLNVTSALPGYFNCNSMPGRYVTIRLPSQTASLQICEVAVFAASSPPTPAPSPPTPATPLMSPFPPLPPPPFSPPNPPPLPPIVFGTSGILICRFNASVQSSLSTAADGGAALIRSMAASAPTSTNAIYFGETLLFFQPPPTSNGMFLTPLMTIAVVDRVPSLGAANTIQAGALQGPLAPSFCGANSPSATVTVLASTPSRVSAISSFLVSPLYAPMFMASLQSTLQARPRRSFPDLVCICT